MIQPLKLFIDIFHTVFSEVFGLMNLSRYFLTLVLLRAQSSVAWNNKLPHMLLLTVLRLRSASYVKDFKPRFKTPIFISN